MSNEENMQQLCDPEKLSKHDLVNYLIAHPDAKGNFKFHTFLSCMWRNLLIARPEFIGVADLEKIHHHDMYKILLEQPQLAPYFDFSKLWDGENRCLFTKRPEIATPETTAFISDYAWVRIVRVHTHLGKFCPWKNFHIYQWEHVLSHNAECLQFFKLDYVKDAGDIFSVLYDSYLGEVLPYKKDFEQNIQDAASFLIFKRIDRTNSKKFLKKEINSDNWEFVEQLCAISPEDALDVYNKKYIPFFMTLKAPDELFEKFLPFFDLRQKDPAGNSFLMAALVRGLDKGDMSRYNFLLSQELDPDEKNVAGFSCNDLVKHLEELKAKEEAARLAREERARVRAKARQLQAKKGKKNGR